MPALTLTPDQVARARNVMERALQFEVDREFPLGVALCGYHLGGATALDVIDALEPFQNPDGGFGNGLEPDLGASASNPFAARIALVILLNIGELPEHHVVDRLANWLNNAQAEDGDWHFSEAVRAGELAPWFANWTFPSLNPACCLAGLGNALGLLSEVTLQRTARLFNQLGSVEEAETAPFYTLLPYIEYLHSISPPDSDRMIDAIANNIAKTSYEDAGHYFDHVLGIGDDRLLSKLPPDQVQTQLESLLTSPAEDGGYTNPYSDDWRPLATALTVGTLALLLDLTSQTGNAD